VGVTWVALAEYRTPSVISVHQRRAGGITRGSWCAGENDPLRDLGDGPVVTQKVAWAKQCSVCSAVHASLTHQESGGEVDVGVVLDVALGLLDYAAVGDELRGATDGDADLGGQDDAVEAAVSSKGRVRL
jgi:hypothetical protein